MSVSCSNSNATSKEPNEKDNSENQPEIKERTLTIWQATLGGGGADLEKPEDEWVYTKLCRMFEEINPGLTIISEYLDNVAAQSKIKAAILAGNAPDIVNTASGYRVTDLKDIYIDISEMIPQRDRNDIFGWSTVAENMDEKNAIYGYPAGGIEIGMLYYNKKLTEQAGVDMLSLKTADDFFIAMRQIQDSGIQPIISSSWGGNYGWLFTFCAWMLQEIPVERIFSNGFGQTKFSEDTAFINSLKLQAQLFDEGLLNKDYATLEDAMGEFYAGNAACTTMGNWDLQNAYDIMGDDVDFIILPDVRSGCAFPGATSGGPGQALCVLNTSKDPQLAVDFLSFVSSRDSTIMLLSEGSAALPKRTDVSAADLGWTGIAILEKQFKYKDKAVVWPDNCLQEEMLNEFLKQME